MFFLRVSNLNEGLNYIDRNIIITILYVDLYLLLRLTINTVGIAVKLYQFDLYQSTLYYSIDPPGSLGRIETGCQLVSL